MNSLGTVQTVISQVMLKISPASYEKDARKIDIEPYNIILYGQYKCQTRPIDDQANINQATKNNLHVYF